MKSDAVHRYLVVAHQTSTSTELIERLREIARGDARAAFVLLVPATETDHLMTWTEGGSQQIARSAADDARLLLEREGLRVADTRVGAPSPIDAIADELRDDPDYAAVVISTLPPGASRWLGLDVHARAERQFKLPIVRVITR